MYFSNSLKFIPPTNLADLADKFTRNEIMSPNEIRQTIGLAPSKDPNADVLKNRNMGPSQENASEEKGGNGGDASVQNKK
jgi:hypothetical protein